MPSIRAAGSTSVDQNSRDHVQSTRAWSDNLRLVDITAVAAYLGVNVRYVRRLVAERDIPFIKLRRLLRFDLDVIDRWVDLSRQGEEQLTRLARINNLDLSDRRPRPPRNGRTHEARSRRVLPAVESD